MERFITFTPVNPHPALNLHPLFEGMGYFLGFQLYLYLRRRQGDILERGVRLRLTFACILGALAGSKSLALLEYLAGRGLAAEAAGPGQALLSGKSMVGGLLGALFVVEAVKFFLKIKVASGDL